MNFLKKDSVIRSLPRKDIKNRFMKSRTIDTLSTVLLIFCVIVIGGALYAFFYKGMTLHWLIVITLFLVAGIIISIASLDTERDSWGIKVENVNKRNSIWLAIGNLIISIIGMDFFVFSYKITIKIAGLVVAIYCFKKCTEYL